MDIFGVITKIDYILGSFLCILGLFLRAGYRVLDIFGVAKISNIFLGCLKFLIFFGWTVGAGPEPTYAEKIRVPPPPPPGRKYTRMKMVVCRYSCWYLFYREGNVWNIFFICISEWFTNGWPPKIFRQSSLRSAPKVQRRNFFRNFRTRKLHMLRSTPLFVGKYW